MSTFKKKIGAILENKKKEVFKTKKEEAKKEKRFVNRFLTVLTREVNENPQSRFFHIQLNDDILSIYNSKEAERLLKRYAKNKDVNYFGSNMVNNLVTVEVRA